MAQGLQLLVSHALGDAGSPLLIGVVSRMLISKQHPRCSFALL